MQIFRNRETTMQPADAKSFVGGVHAKLLASSDAGTPVHVYRVEFQAGGRTNWHRHTGPQWLLVVEGRIRVQLTGEAAQDIETGDAAVIGPGEKHWHGATPDSPGTHIAVNVNFQTEWLEPVNDEDYGGKV